MTAKSTAPETLYYFVELDRSRASTPEDEYTAIGATWGSAGDEYSLDTHALLTVPADRADEAEAILDADPSVRHYGDYPSDPSGLEGRDDPGPA
jgi:hypothetical protein